MLKTKVKANSITNLTDARYFAAWEVEWIGFNLNGGEEDAVSVAEVHAIKEWLDGVKIVGEFGMQTAQTIEAISDELKLETIQLDHFTSLEIVKSLQHYRILKEVVVESLEDLAGLDAHLHSLAPFVEYLILDFNKNNFELSTIDFPLLTTICQKYPVLLYAPFQAAQVQSLIDTVPIKGIVLSGGAEEKVGYKSFDELDDIIEALEILV